MTHDELLRALAPVLRSAATLLEAGEGKDSTAAQASRCLVKVVLLAAHDPVGLAVLDRLLAQAGKDGGERS